MSIFNRFASRGTARTETGKYGGIGERVVNDNRKPIYLVLITDTSGSMSGVSTVIDENGEAVTISKIEQLNDGIKRVVKSLKSFEANNPLYKVNLQIIELNSYGKAAFPEFQPVARNFEEIKFEADGCTELRASLATLKTFISHKYLRDDRPGREGKDYNKAVSVILMSDGWPTDSNGIAQTGPAYRNVVDEFKQYLIDMDYARSVDLYSMAVGDDACEDMLRYFCDGDNTPEEQSRFYRVEACESIASALDYLTRATLAHHTTVPVLEELYNEEEDWIEEEEEEWDDEEEEDWDDEESEDEPDEDEEEESDAQGDEAASDAGEMINDPNMTSEVYQIDIIKCKKDKCAACLGTCPANAFKVHKGIFSIDPDKCTGCGLCESECPYDAIHVVESDTMLDDLFDDIE